MARYNPRDHYAQKAHREGYAARSIYKLKEIDERFHLFRPGQRILDLGCAPGSWLQYASERVGPTGLLVGVDIVPLSHAMPPTVKVVEADIFKITEAELRSFADGYDVVLSDMAPKTTGIRFTDQMRSLELCRRALEIALAVLRPGGAFVCKLFEGPEGPNFIKDVRTHFKKNHVLKPHSTRPGSYEAYIIGMGR